MSYESYYEAIKKQTDADRQAAKDKSNQLYANQAAAANDQYAQQIKETTTAYDEQYRMARIQKAINDRQIAENLANMGLTDSGLNRTQITANQLYYGNTVGKIDRAKQQAVDALALALRGSLTTIENNRLSAEASIDQQYDKYASDAATDMYKADVSAASKASSSGGSGSGKSYLSNIKSDLKASILTESEFKKRKKTSIRSKDGGRMQNFSYTSVDGKLYSSYDEYRDAMLQNIIFNYADKY